MHVPCGKCIGCRLEQARQAAVRCMHEASLHEHNTFLTLTYGEKCPLSLVPRDLQLFWKRLRRAGNKISYFASGEYGEKNGRPHYHAIVFGYWPKDAKYHKRSNGMPIYASDSLNKIWGHGYAYSGTVTFESACYVAGYVAQKVTGPEAPGWYQTVDPATGEIVDIEPEFSRWSTNPAIGKRWLAIYGESDAWRHDEVIMRGSKSKVPRYYDKQFQKQFPERYLAMKLERASNARKVSDAELAASEFITLQKYNSKRRNVA